MMEWGCGGSVIGGDADPIWPVFETGTYRWKTVDLGALVIKLGAVGSGNRRVIGVEVEIESNWTGFEPVANRFASGVWDAKTMGKTADVPGRVWGSKCIDGVDITDEESGDTGSAVFEMAAGAGNIVGMAGPDMTGVAVDEQDVPVDTVVVGVVGATFFSDKRRFFGVEFRNSAFSSHDWHTNDFLLCLFIFFFTRKLFFSKHTNTN